MGKKVSAALQYLQLVRSRVAAVRRDIPHLVELGEQMAKALLAGGRIFPHGGAPWWINEFSSRAGGMMGISGDKQLQTQGKHDVCFFPLPAEADFDPARFEPLQRAMKSKAQLFIIGRPQDLRGLDAGRFAGFTGGVDPSEGLHHFESYQPLAPLWPIETFLRGWLTTGELIAACTRAGKMPLIWMSVWLEGAMPRNAAFFKHDNLHEPWFAPLFHDKQYVPPLDAGYTSGAFLAELEKILDRLETQADRLAQAGQWMAAARENGQKVNVVAVGHSYPRLLNLPDADKKYPLEWGQTNSNLRSAVPAMYGKGDVAVHFGYSPVILEDVQPILKRGLKFVYTSPYGRPAALKDHPNLLWLDLPWRPADATVDVPGYSVRILPMSSSAHSAAYFAMLCELAARMKDR